MLYSIFSVIAPVFICALIGYIWARTRQSFDTAFVTRLITNVSTPCLIFATFMSVEIEMEAFTGMLGAALLSMLGFGIAAMLSFKIFGLNQRDFLPSQLFPNSGNMGLSLCFLAFGEAGLALGITFFAVNVALNFTLGVAIVSGQFTLRGLLKNPMIYSVVITFALVFSGVTAPAWIFNTANLLGGIAIPLMLIALGVSLAQFHINSLRRSFGLSVLRLGAGFCVALLVAELLGLEGVARGVLIIQCSMPVAVVTYLFAARYDRNPQEVAGTVVLSTLLSFLSLPLLLWYVLP